jgi:hypothetical protein
LVIHAAVVTLAPRAADRNLRVANEGHVRILQIGGATGFERGALKKQEAVVGGFRNEGRLRWGRPVLVKARFAHVRREGRHIDQTRDLRVGAGFGDDDAAVGMADENCRAVLPGQHSVHRRNVIPQRGQRDLDDANMVAAVGQDVVDAAPAGTVGEGTVDEQDVVHADGRRRRLGDRRRTGHNQSGRSDEGRFDGGDHWNSSHSKKGRPASPCAALSVGSVGGLTESGITCAKLLFYEHRRVSMPVFREFSSGRTEIYQRSRMQKFRAKRH